MNLRNTLSRKFAAHRCQVVAATIIAILAVSACTTNSATLDIYFVDVEGGQATLVVSPNDKALLIDAGFPGGANDARDARRIAAAANDAGVSQIDMLLVTHFHDDLDLWHMIPSPGDRLRVPQVEVIVVSSDGLTLGSPLDGAGDANESCGGPFPDAEERFENPRSTGVLIQYGEFRFLDLGDLAGQPLSDLVCPRNRIGLVDVYLIPHHGNADAANPATFSALRPRVAILNNGATKGGAAPIFSALRETPDVVDTWQLHRSEAAGAENFPAERIANLDGQTAHWIKLSAKSDGSFRIQNGRTGDWEDYSRYRPTN